MSEWISVEERLPEESEPVLCYHPDVENPSKMYVGNLPHKYYRHNWKCTHWMPLPDTPVWETFSHLT